jgi:hypothetical protein
MSIEIDNIAWRETYADYCKDHISSDELNLQNVFTPYELCGEMIHRLQVYCHSFKDLKFGVFNLEFADILMYDYGVSGEQITFITDCKSKSLFAESERYPGVNIEVINYMDLLNKKGFAKEKKMKFDCIVANYPFQTKSDEKNTITHPIWHKFVEKSFELCKKGGFIAAIHPSGWRNVDGMFKETQKSLKSKNIKYLEIHDEKDGLTHFKAETRYDWYVIENENNDGHTSVVGKYKESCEMDIGKYEFIPNGMFKEIEGLFAKEGQSNVEVIHNSAYHTQRSHMSKEKTNEFIYPCIYTVNSKSECKIRYSNNKDQGHFGIPKLIWSNGRITSIGSFIDDKGDYGLTEFGSAIVDLPTNLPMIKKAFDSDRFRSIMQQCAVGQLSINYKIIALFRKNFWKEFVDENGNEIP